MKHSRQPFLIVNRENVVKTIELLILQPSTSPRQKNVLDADGSSKFFNNKRVLQFPLWWEREMKYDAATIKIIESSPKEIEK